MNLVSIYIFRVLYVYFNVFISCFQRVHFNTTFYASPVVLVSVHHQYDRQAKSFVPPENNIITAWVEVRYHLFFY